MSTEPTCHFRCRSLSAALARISDPIPSLSPECARSGKHSHTQFLRTSLAGLEGSTSCQVKTGLEFTLQTAKQRNWVIEKDSV